MTALPTPPGTHAPLSPLGSPALARVLWPVAAVLFVLVVFFQQTGGSALHQPAPSPDRIEAPKVSATITPRVSIKTIEFLRGMAVSNPALSSQVQETRAELVRETHTIARTPLERLRAVMLTRVLGDDADAQTRLSALRSDLPADSPLLKDADTLGAILDGARPGPNDPGVKGLLERHGYFAQIALVADTPPGDPERTRLLGGGGVLIALGLLVTVVVLGAIVTGTALLMVGIVQLTTGRRPWRMVPAAQGGSLGIEVLTVFLAGFLGIKIVLQALPEEWHRPGALITQWSLMLVLLYPLVRGYDWKRARAELGLHTGQGVLREVLCGITGYLASLPFLLIGLGCSVLILVVQSLAQQAAGGEPAPMPENELLDLFSLSGWMLVGFASLALIWAPIVEETVMRGALLGQLHARWHLVPAVVVTAIVFALMHGYAPVKLPVLVGLAVGFGFIRAWRGSLIACMTAHALHNGFTTILLLSLLKLVGE